MAADFEVTSTAGSDGILGCTDLDSHGLDDLIKSESDVGMEFVNGGPSGIDLEIGLDVGGSLLGNSTDLPKSRSEPDVLRSMLETDGLGTSTESAEVNLTAFGTSPAHSRYGSQVGLLSSLPSLDKLFNGVEVDTGPELLNSSAGLSPSTSDGGILPTLASMPSLERILQDIVPAESEMSHLDTETLRYNSVGGQTYARTPENVSEQQPLTWTTDAFIPGIARDPLLTNQMPNFGPPAAAMWATVQSAPYAMYPVPMHGTLSDASEISRLSSEICIQHSLLGGLHPTCQQSHVDTRASRRRRKGRLSLAERRKIEQQRFPPEKIGDLKGTTSAKAKTMSNEERQIVLHKRRLRNRESAKRSRERRRIQPGTSTEKTY